VVQLSPAGAADPAVHPRGLERKREILAAASRVFRRRGVPGAGMREIAAEAGMTAGNLYYYFENRQALLAFCQEDGLSGLLQLAARVASLDLPPQDRLYLLIVGHLERLNERTPGSLAHLEVEGLDGPFREAILSRRAEYEGALRALVQEGVDAGLFRPADAKVAALAILGALNWTVKWFRAEGGKPLAEIGREFAELLVRGLLAPGVELAAPDLAGAERSPGARRRRAQAAER
jgi:AcrR family transcriptional regulator